MLDKTLVDPDNQLPLPFQAAVDYAQTVMGWAQAPLPTDVVAVRNLAYGEDRLQHYDVFAPKNARNLPVLVFWHGGGWTNGYRDYVSFMAPHVTRLGMLLVAPSYRLAPQHRLPAALDDCYLLLDTLAGTLPGLGGSSDHLYLSGHSAGGHLATLAALRIRQRNSAGLPAEAVRGCLPISGIMDLYHPAPPADSLEERVYTMVLRDVAEDAVMSPICWTPGNTMPMLLSYGESDSERVIKSNRRLHALLQLQAGPVELRMDAGCSHFDTHTTLREAGHPWYRSLERMVENGARA